jgi:hypothetical protein
MREASYINDEMAIKTVKDKDVKQYKGLENKELWKIRSEIHRLGNQMHYVSSNYYWVQAYG